MTTNVKAFLTDVNRDGFHEVAEAIRAASGKDAKDINYDNIASGLDADNVQDAIDEVAGDVSEIAGDVSDLETAVSGKVSKSGDTMTGKLTIENDLDVTGDVNAQMINTIGFQFYNPLDGHILLSGNPTTNQNYTVHIREKTGTMALLSDLPKSHILTLPTSGYTSGSVSIWGETLTLYSIVISTDKDGNPLTNFTSGMTADYPINISGSNSDFAKLYAFEIGNGSVTVYMTSAPSTAFNVMIKEG